MGKRLEHTPNSQIRSAIRKLFLRSRERQAALKRDKYTCQTCGKKQSRAAGREVCVEVDHTDGIDWEGLFDEIRRRVLHPPERLRVLCKECHAERTEGQKTDRLTGGADVG
jgi:5-methylcytosine-specific restriction endonuclease McrA